MVFVILNRFITLGARLYKDDKWHSDPISRAFLTKDILPNEKVLLNGNVMLPKRKDDTLLFLILSMRTTCGFSEKDLKN